MTALLVITALLLLVSGLVKLHAAGRVGLGVTVLPLVEIVAGLGLLAPLMFAWRPAPRAGLFIVCGWTLAVLMIVAGRFLAKRQHRTFCIVVAAMACLFMPFGTILGVFTIVVLMRESVQALFEGGKQAAPPPAPAEG